MEQVLKNEVIFWGDQYGKIYPELEAASPYKELLSQIEKLLGKHLSGRWLDAGCGSGGILELLWRLSGGKIKEIIALDLTETMLAHARKKVGHFSFQPSAGQISFLKHDLSNKLPFDSDYFDGIIANLVLPYVVMHQGRQGRAALSAVLAEIHRVLKPGGVFIWSSPVKGVKFWKVFIASWRQILNPGKPMNLYYGPAILKHALRIQKKGREHLYNFLTESELLQAVSATGFCEPEIYLSFAKQAYVIKVYK